MKLITVMVIILMTPLLALAGCTEEEGAFDVTITATSGSSTADGEGLCGYGDDEECHSIVVSIENRGTDDFSTNMFNWEAVASSGGVYKSPSVDGPDACAGGSTCSVTLNFDVTNDDTLTTIKWEDFLHDLSASIPSY
jgi:hypothetical protein